MHKTSLNGPGIGSAFVLALGEVDDEKFATELKKHTKSYSWIKNNYLETTVLDETYFLDELGHLVVLPLEQIKHKIEELDDYEFSVKKEKQTIYLKYSTGKYKFSEDLKLSLSILETMSWWIDQRKIVMLHGFRAIFEILKRVCMLYNDKSGKLIYDLPNLKYATDSEIINLLADNELIDKNLLAERRKYSLQALDINGEWTLLSGKNAKEVHAVFMKKFAAKEIRGLTASLGKEKAAIQGEVSVVSNVNKDYFKPGNILVTSMTRPEFVPLMRKAKAIVTDEGGITCHAAIVSRELGIPCIIGTRVATKILKTGDKIEMNLKNGVVRKI